MLGKPIVFADADPTITAVIGNDSRFMLRTGAGGVTHTNAKIYNKFRYKDIMTGDRTVYNILVIK